MKYFSSTLLLLALSLFANGQGVFTSNANGDYNTAATWTLSSGTDGDGIPDSDDQVSIVNHAITMNAASAASTLQLTAGNTETSSLTISNAALVTFTIGTQLTLSNTGTGTNTITLNGGTIDLNGALSFSGTAAQNVINANDDAGDGIAKAITWSGTITPSQLANGSFTFTDTDNDATYNFTYDGLVDQVYLSSGSLYTFKTVTISNTAAKVWLNSTFNTSTLIKNKIIVSASATFSDSSQTTGMGAGQIDISAGGIFRRVNNSTYTTTQFTAGTAGIFEFYVTNGNTCNVVTELGTYPIIYFNGTGTKVLNNDLDIANRATNSVTVKAGTLQIGTSNSSTFVFNTSISGPDNKVHVDSAATLEFLFNITKPSTMYFGFSRYSTVKYSCDCDQVIYKLDSTVSTTAGYGKLTLTGSTTPRVKSLAATTTVEVWNTLTLGNAGTDASTLSIPADGFLSLRSDSLSTGSIGQLMTINTINYNTTGKIIARKYIYLPTDQFRDYTSPIQGATLADFQNSGLYMTGITGATYAPPTFTYVNAYSYNEALNTASSGQGWVAATNITNTIGNGFRIYGGAYDQVNLTLASSGQIKRDDQTYNLTFNQNSGNEGNDGWNLISNPFPSPIDWQKVVTDGSQSSLFSDSANTDPGAVAKVGKYAYVWAPKDMNSTSEAVGYGIINGTTGVSTLPGNKSKISQFQAFFVKAIFPLSGGANPSTTTITIKESHKADTINATHYKAAGNIEVGEIIASAGNSSSNLFFHEYPGATSGNDGSLDIGRFSPPVDVEGATPGGKIKLDFAGSNGQALNLWLNAVAKDANSITLPLILTDSTSGSHTLKFNNVNAFAANFSCAQIRDNVTGQFYDIKNNTVVTYQNTANYSGNRFTLYFNNTPDKSVSDATCSKSTDGDLTVNFPDNSSKDFTVFKDASLVNNYKGVYSKIKNTNLAPGSYTLVNNLTGNGCSVKTTPFTISSAPDISFNVTPSALVTNTPITFTNTTTGASAFLWTFIESGQTFTDVSPVYTFTTPGTKLVKLDANSVNPSCNDAKVYQYEITPNGIVTIGNPAEGPAVTYKSNVVAIYADNMGSFDCYIYTIDGKLLHSQTRASGDLSVTLSGVNGPVVVTIKSGDKLYTKKLF